VLAIPEEGAALLRGHLTTQWATSPKAPFLLISVPLRIRPLGAHSDHQGGIVSGLTINRSVENG
jgi:hypothetical protein